jgi:hypothetical protein
MWYLYEFLFIHNASMALNEAIWILLMRYWCIDDPNNALNLLVVFDASISPQMPWIYLWYWCPGDPNDALNLLAMLMARWFYWCLEFTFDINDSMTLMMPWVYLVYWCLNDPNNALNLLVIFDASVPNDAFKLLVILMSRWP